MWLVIVTITSRPWDPTLSNPNPSLGPHVSWILPGSRCRIQLQDKDESLPGLKLVQEPSDQRVVERSQDISFLVRLGPSFAPQRDELGSTEHFVPFMLNPFHKTKHTSGGERERGNHGRCHAEGGGGVLGEDRRLCGRWGSHTSQSLLELHRRNAVFADILAFLSLACPLRSKYRFMYSTGSDDSLGPAGLPHNDGDCSLVPVPRPGPGRSQATHHHGLAAPPCRAPVPLHCGQGTCRRQRRLEPRQSTPRNI